MHRAYGVRACVAGFLRPCSQIHCLCVDILILCPDREVPLLSEHVRNCWISGVDVHRGQSNSNAQRHGAKHDSSFSVEVHGLSERGEEAEFGLDVEKNAATGAGGRGIDVRKPDLNRKHGDADEGPNADTEGGVELIGLGGTGTPGTARIMRRWRDWIRVSILSADRQSAPQLIPSGYSRTS